jgi:hypothetical protein
MSNATKNQTDTFSRYIQSYWTKTHNALFYLSLAMFYEMELEGLLLIGGFAIAMMIDAGVGLNILRKIFGSKK